ncbi:HNH endonuclease domain-containing protein [Alistipes putredinis]|uniref:HNH endonuclease domain-containing protein n=1 Tax=Alistipes putredinis TaxID=28117 RepID=UPI003AB2964E
MKQIVIQKHIRSIAKDYLKVLRQKGATRYQTPEDRLLDFEKKLRKKHLPDYADYIKAIRRHYPIIIRLQPECYEWFHKRYFESLTHNLDLSKKIKYGATTKKFYEWVSDRMRYDDVRSSWLLPFMKQLNIKTCCYCNAQYATTFINEKDFMASYDLDHCYPQSKYPYLSTSFFNLIPSCGCCNRHKSDRDDFHFPLYVNQHKHLLQFNIELNSMIQYWLTADQEILRIDIVDGKDAPLGFANEYDKVFHIRKLYTAYVDEAEELLWKARIYNDSYREQLRQSFDKLFAHEPAKFSRFYYCFYTEESDILKRPLSKMKQDIAKQIGLI